MNACMAPQSSEHWPRKVPESSVTSFCSVILPGIASSLTPRPGSAIAWITSTAVTEKMAEDSTEIKSSEEVPTPNNSPRDSEETRTWSAEEIVQYHCTPKMSEEITEEKSEEKAATTTIWFKENIPMIGNNKARNSILREETPRETADWFRWLTFSLADSKMHSTEKKAEESTDQIKAEAIKTEIKIEISENRNPKIENRKSGNRFLSKTTWKLENQ